MIIVKQTKNHVGRLKNYRYFQIYLCNVIVMSY